MIHPRVIRERVIVDVSKGESGDIRVGFRGEPGGALPRPPGSEKHFSNYVIDWWNRIADEW
jgi:hypothetical protein